MAERDLGAIHEALLAGDRTASRDLVNTCTSQLYAILKHRYSVFSQETVQDAVNDALIALIVHPERYSPSRGSLINYLVHIGANKLKDQLRSYRRRANELAVGGTVELAEAEANAHGGDGTGEWDAPAGADLLSPDVEALLVEILPEPQDRRIWELICDGRTAVADFAEVIGIDDLPPEEQRREVKRHRDRVQKRVFRRREEFRRLLS